MVTRKGHDQFLAVIVVGTEPTTFIEAVQDPGWRKAMQEEIDAFERNGTWKIIDLPPRNKVIGCKCVFKFKYRSYGVIEQLKGHLVVFGNRQVAGIDFNETFAPVAKMVTIRMFLAFAVARQWVLH